MPPSMNLFAEINQTLAEARIAHCPNRGAYQSAPINITEQEKSDALHEHFSLAAAQSALTEISQWRGYAPTPLVSLDDFAAQAGVGAVYYKDESRRFALGSFKALGGAYAVLRLVQRQLRAQGIDAIAAQLESGAHRSATESLTVVTATDGNHGRSVAWGAARFGCACRIYIHAAVSESRAQAMRELGAAVVRVRGNYDDSVHCAARDAEDNGWFVVSDTSYPGYVDVPAQVMAGYAVMMAEAAAQWQGAITHLFVQGGVGGLAASMTAWLRQTFGRDCPRIIVVEPQLADCLFQSARNGCATRVHIDEETVMAGLSCGEVSALAWQVLADCADDFLTIGDELVAPLMRALAKRDDAIEAGESAVAGLGGCLAACADAQLKSALRLTRDSRVLTLGTEGATDRAIYDSIVGG